MTRFLPIDRPLVYGDIVAYSPDGEETADRNVYLREYWTAGTAEWPTAVLVEIATATGVGIRDGGRILTLSTQLLRLVVEE